MVLETERLRLRPYEWNDLDDLHTLWTDAGVRRYLWDDIVIDRERAAGVVQLGLSDWARVGVGQWVVTLRGEEACVGFCGVLRFGNPEEWEILYGFYPEFWGQGLAVESASAVLSYAFETLGCRRIAARTDPPNRASMRVMEKLGMKRAPDTPAMMTYWINREDWNESTNRSGREAGGLSQRVRLSDGGDAGPQPR